MFGAGVALSSGNGLQRVAYGIGPVLSMSTVLVLLPSLSSIIIALRENEWMNKVHSYIHTSHNDAWLFAYIYTL